jgi:hypothetical protein
MYARMVLYHMFLCPRVVCEYIQQINFDEIS